MLTHRWPCVQGLSGFLVAVLRPVIRFLPEAGKNKTKGRGRLGSRTGPLRCALARPTPRQVVVVLAWHRCVCAAMWWNVAVGPYMGPVAAMPCRTQRGDGKRGTHSEARSTCTVA